MKNLTILKKLQKFGLKHCDLPTMLWNISVILRVLTLNIDNRYRKQIPKIFYIILILCTILYYYVHLVSLLWFVFIRCPETGDLMPAMVVLALGMYSEIAIIKLFFLLGRENTIRNMIDDYLECNSFVIPGSRFYNNLMKYLKKVKLRAISYWLVIMTNAIAYVMKPAFMTGRHLIEDLYVIYGLEPRFESPNYELSNLSMGITVVFVCYITASTSAFFIIIVGYIEAQLLSLSNELLTIWEDSTKQYYKTIKNIYPYNKNIYLKDAKKIINQEIKERLIKIIKVHAKNINLLRQVEFIFRESMAFSFLFLVTSLIAELLGGFERTYLQIPYTLSQLLVDCFAGQRVIDASVYFERAVYNCKWENFDVNNMKIILLMLRNAQKTLTLSTGGMASLSFSTITITIRGVYSSYTTLRTVIKKN